AELRWSDVEPFGAVLADPHHVPASARARQILRFEYAFLARKLLRQGSGRARLTRGTRLAARRRGRLVLLLCLGDRGLNVLEGQLELIRVQLLRPRSEPSALELPGQM